MGAGERRSGGPWVSGPAAPGRLAVGLRDCWVLWSGGVGVWQQAALVTQDNCSLVPLPPPTLPHPPSPACHSSCFSGMGNSKWSLLPLFGWGHALNIHSDGRQCHLLEHPGVSAAFSGVTRNS